MPDIPSPEQILQADYKHARDIAGMSHEDFIRMRKIKPQEAVVLLIRYQLPQPVIPQQSSLTKRLGYYYRK